MLARRLPTLTLLFAGAAAACLIVTAGCKDSSNTVAGPAVMASVNVTGTWTGTFHGTTGCPSAPMTATLTQTGARVTGTVITPSCGLSSGYLKATIEGYQLNGSIGMMGCTGGAVNGAVSADGRQLSFSMGDLTKPLVTGDKVIAPGGDGNLTK